MCGGAGEERAKSLLWRQNNIVGKNFNNNNCPKNNNNHSTLHSHSSDSRDNELIAIIPISQVLLPLGLGCGVLFFFLYCQLQFVGLAPPSLSRLSLAFISSGRGIPPMHLYRNIYPPPSEHLPYDMKIAPVLVSLSIKPASPANH